MRGWHDRPHRDVLTPERPRDRAVLSVVGAVHRPARGQPFPAPHHLLGRVAQPWVTHRSTHWPGDTSRSPGGWSRDAFAYRYAARLEHTTWPGTPRSPHFSDHSLSRVLPNAAPASATIAAQSYLVPSSVSAPAQIARRCLSVFGWVELHSVQWDARYPDASFHPTPPGRPSMHHSVPWSSVWWTIAMWLTVFGWSRNAAPSRIISDAHP